MLERHLEIAKEEGFPSKAHFCSDHEKDDFLLRGGILLLVRLFHGAFLLGKRK